MGWQKVISLDSKKSYIYLFLSIFRVLTVKSQVISYSIIVLTSTIFFMLNFLMSWFFSYCNTLKFLDLKARLSMYISTIISVSFYLIVGIQVFALVEMKPIFWKNLVIVLFQNVSIYFNSYKLFNILQVSFFWPTRYLWKVFT